VAWQSVPANNVEQLLRALVDALDFQDSPVRQIVRTNLVVGVLKDHLEEGRGRPALGRLERTTQALREVAQGADDEIAMAAAQMVWDLTDEWGPR
jgi:hypothetical protein